MQAKHFVMMSLIVICSLNWSVESRAYSTKFSIGGKLWYADADVPGYRGREVNIDPGINWGPVVSVDFGNDWGVSGVFLIGTYDYGSVTDYYHDWYERGGELSSQDAEIAIERSFNMLDIGGGFRYAAWKWEPATGRGEKQDVTSYGPMVSLGVEYPFSKIPIGGYLEASWLFIELGDEKNTEHLNAEGGLFFTIENLKGTFGYRYKNYYKLYEDYVELDSDSLVFDGFVLSLGYMF